MELLQHPELKRLSSEFGAKIVFLPHPNLRGNLSGVKFPDHVTVIQGAADVNELLSASRVNVTDYSSIFFEGALSDSRVVYFQFDRDSYLTGAHTHAPGYWDYDEHGFGPIALEAESAAKLICDAFTQDLDEWPALYQERVRRTLPLADGAASERIVDAIETRLLKVGRGRDLGTRR